MKCSLEELPDFNMARRVRVFERVISGIRIAIEILEITRACHDGIRRNKPAKDGVIVRAS